MLFVEILALADDLTGALEVGAKFAARGIASRVTIQVSPRAGEGVRALVIDTETRHLPARQAAERVQALAAGAGESGVQLVYKKTDSTLRGNIGSELGALATAFPGRRVAYAPAYPTLGRTVRQGRLYVDGRPVEETAFAWDAWNPIREGSIPRLLGEYREAIDVYDGECDSDVMRVARIVMEGECPRLAAGPAALAGCLAECLAPQAAEPAWPAIAQCLVVNGSRHEVSRAQVRYAEAHGCVDGSDWAVLDLPETPGESGSHYAARVGEAVCARLRETEYDALAVFGGDTAFAILSALGCAALEPVGEVLPGVPLARLPGRPPYLISKAGGFGAPDVLCALRKRLS